MFEPILSIQFFQRRKDLNANKYVKKLKTTQLTGATGDQLVFQLFGFLLHCVDIDLFFLFEGIHAAVTGNEGSDLCPIAFSSLHSQILTSKI
jgi:hypothetical protein